ncbi:xylose isomerase-like protein [Lasiosphaeria miniovina]|uniref:Apurinic-apyrimidinic endonuclease 1 n=1 Tax=Lasiosphaeria miniovina TaxID=1954250 RepID=A0AA40EB38_9PEZI|nr:xylose isomerase-like protein [Lasiosphaeria miniovina]KAK0733460.1 xylose isomerase-like protein [Lasiosphaeria miniovina]
MVRSSTRSASASKASALVNKTKTVIEKSKAAVSAKTSFVNGAAKTKPAVQGPTAAKRKAAALAEDVNSGPDDKEEEEKKKPAAKKRNTSKKAAGSKPDDMPLATRTAVASLPRAVFIGAHVSGAGGVQNSISNAVQIGANAFAVFLKSQRRWQSLALAPETTAEFHAMLKQHGYDGTQHILPHGSYLINLAQADAAKADQAYGNFIDDLERCEALGIRLWNFHPGSTGGDSMEAAVARIAAQLNKAHKATKSVVTVLENMCGSGNVVGSRFEELRDIINLVDDKSRVGVCIDTCHAFAAGYDLRSPDAFAATVAEFDDVVGLKYLRAFHLNDSKAPFGSHRDLHANIGTGFLGLRAFHSIVNHAPFQNLPMVLETPIDEKGPDGKTVENTQIWADEIKLLEGMIGQDAESAEFEARAAELQAKGTAERAKIQDQVDKKTEKDAKKGTRGKKAAAKKKKGQDSDSEDDHGHSHGHDSD